MNHTVKRPTPPFFTSDGSLKIHQIPVWQDNLVWLITKGDEAAVVDGPQAGEVLDYCKANGLRLTTVLNTHTHMDHVGINNDLSDRGLLSPMRVIGPRKVSGSVPGITEPVDDGDEVELFGQRGRVMLTEGHIDGHSSFVFDDVLFCGDTLFAGGCGYLFDGPPRKMFDSLHRLSKLAPQTRVCCAHEYTQDNLRFAWSIEPENEALSARIKKVWAIREQGGCTVPSTIAEELSTNPFMRHNSKALVERLKVTADSDPSEIFAATRALKDSKAYRDMKDDALPLNESL